MGYDLHITRRVDWADEEGPAISLAEWHRVIEQDPELSACHEVGTEDAGEVASFRICEGALWWYDGEIQAKNPEKALVIKMVAIAQALGARVQGDDGEIYRADGTAYEQEGEPARGEPRAATPTGGGLLSRIGSWFRGREPAPPPASSLAPGMRVRTALGETGTVLEVDASANTGLGRVRVKLDDGREQDLALVASGLEPADA